MSEDQGVPNGRVTVADVYAVVERTEGRLTTRLDAIEGKLDRRFNDTDARVKEVESRLDNLDGRFDASIGLIKWLGPAGVIATLIGLAKVFGVF